MNPLPMFFVYENNRLLTTTPVNWQSELVEETQVKLGGKDYQVFKTYFSIDSPNQALGYYVVLKAITPGRFERLSEDSQFFLAATLAAPTILLLAAGALIYWTMPELIAPILGWSIRPVVALSLLGTGLLIANQIKGNYASAHPTLFGSYLYVLFIWLGLYSAFFWLGNSVPSKPLVVWPDDYAAYFSELRAKFVPVWPIVLCLIPWLVFVLNLLGLEPIAKGFYFLRGRAKVEK